MTCRMYVPQALYMSPLSVQLLNASIFGSLKKSACLHNIPAISSILNKHEGLGQSRELALATPTFVAKSSSIQVVIW